jgi:hypothetical protein
MTEVQTEASPEAAPETGNAAESPSTTESQQVVQFYNPKDVPPELQDSFKRMQKSYTQAMQSANAYKPKVEAYDSFMADPVGNMQRLAAQQGYTLTRAQAAAAVAEQSETDWQPKTWNEVTSKAKEEAKKELLAELSPFLSDIKKTKQTQIETILDGEYPEWRDHEKEMIGLINSHPTLANDPAMLVRLAIPKEVIESRAMQQALSRIQKRTEASQVTSGSTTSKTATHSKPDRPLNFNEAVAFAKEKLARNGQR